MSSFSGLLGGGGGTLGTGVTGPAGTNQTQLDQAYGNTENGINQQQQFVNALNKQNGLQNQSSVFQQQQGLANQLQGVANGTGPNPAMAQLAQATGANTSNQAALMAGQRGSNANVGLLARQAAMQGANTQQQAVGQGSTMQAQQSLNALSQLQGQQSSMGNMANAQVGQQQAGLSALNQASQGQQSNLLQAQSSINSANATLANTQAQGQQGALGGLLQGAAAVAPYVAMAFMADGGEVPRKMFAEGTPSDAPPAQAAITQAAPTFLQPVEKFTDPLANPAVNAAGSGSPATAATGSGPQSIIGQAVAGFSGMGGSNPGAQSINKGMSALGSGIANGIQNYQNQPVQQTTDPFNSVNSPNVGSLPTGGTPGQSLNSGAWARGGQVPALVSPGEVRIKAKDVPKVAKGEKAPLDGEKIPGKPKVGGDKNSYANDTVPKTLNEGDIILPRSVTQAKDPAAEAHKFVSAILAKNGQSMPKRAKK
jgi:hypothetical protein